LTVAVEFKTSAIDLDHQHGAREIQLLEMVNNGTPEEWELIIEQDNKLDDGTFEIEVLDPKKNGKKWSTDPIPINSNDDVIQKRFK
jgi:hypothetical protein